jgi:arginyl-tRNA synthetase
MNLSEIIIFKIQEALKALFNTDVEESAIALQDTRKEFEGQVTVVTFPFIKISKKSPEETGALLGEYLVNNTEEVVDFNVVKGFLNLSISDAYWINSLSTIFNIKNYGKLAPKNSKVMVEYSSPNTNKPLHLGHVRNNLLGYSVA